MPGIVSKKILKEREEMREVISLNICSISNTVTDELIAKHAGISPSTYCNIKNGKRLPTVPVLVNIAKALGVSVDFLVGLE